MEIESAKKAAALVAAVGKHAEALRRLMVRNGTSKDHNAVRSILEAHEGYIMACEAELVHREIAKQRLRIR
jgi:hypothetical protein